MIRGIDHINIVVANLERAEKFYSDVLGMHISHRAHLAGEWIERLVGLPDVSAELVYLETHEGGPRVELLCYRSPEGMALLANSFSNTCGLRHIAFRVNDIDAEVARLRELGVRVFTDPMAVPYSVVAHVSGEKRFCYFFDPEGVLLELAEYRKRDPDAPQ